MPISELENTVVEDIEWLDELHRAEQIRNRDIRIVAGTILRRLLIHNDLGKVAGTRKFPLLINSPQNNPIIRACECGQIEMFQSANAQAFGIWISSIMLNRGNKLPPLPGYSPDDFTLLKVDKFLKQKVFFHRGVFADRADVIKYVANKMGGPHFDDNREKVHGVLDDVRTMIRLSLDADGTPTISISPDPDRRSLQQMSAETNVIDPVLFELIATCRFLCESDAVQRMCGILKESRNGV